MQGLQGLPAARARVLLSGGLLALWQGDFASAETLLEEVTCISKEAGATELAAYASTFLGRAARDQGKRSAPRLGSEAVNLFRDTNDAWGLGVALHFLGLAELEEDTGAATIHFEESASIFRRMGARLDLAMPKRGLGLAAYIEGDYARARSLFEESANLFRPFGDEWSLAMVAHDLGCVAQSQGRDAEAAALLARSLRSWRKLANTRGVLTALAGLGGVAATAGHASDGACLLGAVGAIRRSAGIALEPTDQATVDRTVGLIQARLSPAAFEEATREGSTLDLDEAVELGLRVESLVTPTPAKSASPATHPLTPRECEVARLLPLGMTNREIAGFLVISEGTAGLHVKHILAKLGFSSRAQAAAWAVEKGLATSGGAT